MTVHVEPSNQRGEANHDVLSIIARWGRTNWIAPTGLDIEAGRRGLTGTPLNGAAITTSGTSLDVSIDTFEAFIGGAWVASDDATIAEHTHTLPGNATTTTLYLGYDLSAADTFIFGPAGEFAADDPKVPIVDATDDGTAVTDTDDRRPLGPQPDLGVLVDATFDDDDTTTLNLDTGTLSQTYPQYTVVIYRESHDSAEEYQNIRLNGVSSDSYKYDVFNGFDNSFSSASGTSFGKIAGTDLSDSNHTAWTLQHLAVTCPPEVVANGQHFPIIDTLEKGVGRNVDHLFHGHLPVDSTAVDRLNVFGGGDSTGWIAMFGSSRIVGL